VASIDSQTPAAELLRESGGALLVEPESPAELADAFLRLHADRALADELGDRGRSFAEARLSKGAALTRLEEIILDGVPR
jgi:colanic acid biosynthesis glycosyl transferase WcaI